MVNEPNDLQFFICLSKAGQKLLYKVRNERDEWLGKAIEQTLNKKEQEMLAGLLSHYRDW